ncbi:MAG: NADP-dependent oxidoreductase [Anaerolineales bacterium]
MTNGTMKAIRIQDYGAADQLVLQDAPIPEPGPGQVRLRLLRAGVNPADWKYRAGLYKQFMPLAFPWTPGMEGAGVVDAVGEGVTDFKPGQAVLGVFNASYAEYALAEAGDLIAKPEALSFDEAASLPVGALTAWQAVEEAGLQPGQRVLVHGGAGGVGVYVVQLARLKGAHVIATASGGNAEFVRSLGAEQVIDYTTQSFEKTVRDVDAVIDTVGGEVVERSWQVLKPGGILVTVAAMVSPDQAEARGVRGKTTSRAPAAALRQIVPLVESKKLRPVVGRVFPLAQAAEAHKASETGHGRGRIILHIAD